MAVTTVTTEPLDSYERLEDTLERMRSSILRYAGSRLGEARAGDVLSDVFHSAWVAAQRGQVVTAAWLMTVTRHKVVDTWRRLERNDRLVERMRHERFRGVANPESLVVRGEVDLTLAKLRPNHRSLLVRHYVEGKPIALIAEEDRVSVTATESAIARARAAFRRLHVPA